MTTNIYAQEGNCFNTLVSVVNQDSVAATIQHLESYGSRYMLDPNRLEIATWIRNKLGSFGLSDVRIDSFETHVVQPYENIDTILTQYNVIGVLEGSGCEDDKILIGAHYDSYSTSVIQLHQAPGADDNATGVASVLECARAMTTVDCNIPQTIEFVAFAAEEYMSFCTSGSEYHASQIAATGDSIVLMINNDMIGHNDGNNSVSFSNYPSLQWTTDLAILSCQTFTNLNYNLWPSNWAPFADVKPFYQLNIPVVYMEETAFSPFYHTTNDIIGNIDEAYCTEVVKCALGTILLYDELNLATKDHLHKKIKVYPNPVKNSIKVDIPGSLAFETVQVISIEGQLIMDYPRPENAVLDVSMLPAGMYLLRVQSNDTHYTVKFLKLN